MASKRAQTIIEPTRDELEPIEIASRDEIEALQLSRLKATLLHAYDHVAAYRRKFDAAGVHPRDLKTLADLKRFPEQKLVTIDDFGGWKKAQPAYFGDGGIFDQIYKPGQ